MVAPTTEFRFNLGIEPTFRAPATGSAIRITSRRTGTSPSKPLPSPVAPAREPYPAYYIAGFSDEVSRAGG
jgi:hypothetical protein